MILAAQRYIGYAHGEVQKGLVQKIFVQKFGKKRGSKGLVQKNFLSKIDRENDRMKFPGMIFGKWNFIQNFL